MYKLINKICLFFILGFASLPMHILAHGTEDEHKKEIFLSYYIFAGFSFLFILFLILYLSSKNRNNLIKWIWIAALAGTLISGTIALSKDAGNELGLDNSVNSDGTHHNPDAASSSNSETNPDIHAEITLTHIHGLGYSPNGDRIMIPAHDGLLFYSDGIWAYGPGERHDYMGFSIANEGFYSSGHPAPDSTKLNPLGLVKSADLGKTIELLSLYGKVDFHLMNVSYNTHTIYVMNPHSNSKMQEIGLYYSKDEGNTWIKGLMKGYDGDSAALAVHPDDDAIVVLGSQTGVYISKDYGDHFERIANDQITSLYFNHSGKLIMSAYSQGKAAVSEMNIDSGEQSALHIPSLEKDAVLYIANHPTDDQKWVIATFNKDVYISNNHGKEWEAIALKGKGIFRKN